MTDAPLIEWAESRRDWRPFHGSTYIEERDGVRLNAQCQRVFNIMRHGQWHTLSSLSIATGDPQASVSARIRQLRSSGYKIEREYVSRGLWRYRMVV